MSEANGLSLWGVIVNTPDNGTQFFAVSAASSQDAVDTVCNQYDFYNYTDDMCSVEPLEFLLNDQYNGIAALTSEVQ